MKEIERVASEVLADSLTMSDQDKQLLPESSSSSTASSSPRQQNETETENGVSDNTSFPRTKSRRPPSRDPLRNSIYARYPQMVIDKLKPVKENFLDVVHTVESRRGSISQLSLNVNDSGHGDNTFDDCYLKQEILGEGGFACVYRCQHKIRKNYYAVKEIYNTRYEADGQTLKMEIESMKRLREHPYMVRLLDIFSEPDRTFLVMEELQGGDLLDRLAQKEFYNEREGKRISRKLLEAIHFCHKKEIAHRDIKPDNILLVSKSDDTNIKLGDFGCAHKITGPKCMKTLCGSPQYVAPELYLHEGGYDERCDLWSAGVVIYALLGGYTPFEGEDHELPDMICEGWFRFHAKYWGDFSEAPKDLIRGLLKVNPDDRATLEECLDGEYLRRRDRESIVMMAESMSNLDDSVSAFDAWVKRQQESTSLNFGVHSFHAEEDDDDTESISGHSLSVDEL